MQLLKQSTASTVYVGPVLDSAGAAVTTAVVGDFRLVKNGTAATLSGATVTHDANGYYTVALTTTNTDTTGRLTLAVGNTAMSMSTHRYSVLLASVYDALITNATNATGGLPTATGSISALAGAISTYAGGDTSGVTTLLTRLPSAISLNAGAVTVGTNNDKTGYSLVSGTGLGNQTANITGNLSGSVGSVTSGVTVATNNDKTGYSLVVAPLTSSQTASAVWDALIASYTVSGSFGARVMRLDSASSGNAAKVTSAGHVASDVHELQPAVIDNTHFSAGAIDANAIAADAAAEIAVRVADEPLAGHTTAGTLGKVLSDAGSGVTTLLGRITSSVATMFSDLITMITGSGVSPKWSANALSLAPTGGGGGGTGTGARTVTITTQLSGAPLEGASVRLTKGAETYVGQTNVSGQLTFNVDDGTWVVSITSPGATFGGASLVVDGPETMTYSLTAISISPSAPGAVTGYWLCLGVNGLIESGVTMSMQAVEVPEGSTGLALDTTIRTATSNGSGVAQFTDLVPGARYSAWRGTGSKRYITIPEDASGSLELNSLLGSP